MFGGAYHAPHAMYLEQCFFFYGKELPLLNPAATRFASFFIRMMRILHGKAPLRGTVHSAKYQALGKTEFEPVNAMINSDPTFDQRSIVLKASLPVLWIVCLADSYAPHMDKLWYYVKMTDDHLINMAKHLNDANYFPEEVAEDVPELQGDDPDVVDEEEDPPEYDSDDEVMSDDGDEDYPPTQSAEENMGIDPSTFAGKMIKVWLQYRSNFDYDYSRAGYMLSVVPDIFEHMKVIPRNS